MAEGTPQSSESKPPVEPTVRLGGTAVRVQVGADGQTTVSHVGQQSHQALQPSATEATGRSSTGAPVERPQWSDDTIISSPLIGGNGRLRELVSAGLVKRTPTGYVIVGEVAASEVAPQPEEYGKPNEAPAPEASARDAEDAQIIASLPAVAPEVTGFMKSVTEATSAQTIDAAVGMLAEGADTDALVRDVAQRSGMEPGQVSAGMEKVIESRTDAAKQIAASLGVPEVGWDAFVSDLSARPGDHKEVLQAMATGNIAPLADALRAYAGSGKFAASFPVDGLPEVAEGIGARIVDGTLVLNLPQHGEVTLKDALARKLVKLSKRQS